MFPIQSHGETSVIPQSIFAPSLTTHTSGTNSYTFPLTNPLLASSLSRVPSTLPRTTTDNHSSTIRTPYHQRLTLPTNTLQFTTPPDNSHEELQKLYPLSSSVKTSINETRDTNIPQIYPHSCPYFLTITQLYMQGPPNHFQIPALDYTKNHFYSPVTKATNLYDVWIQNISNFMNVQFNLIKSNKLESSNLTNNKKSLDRILPFRRFQQYSYENFYAHHAVHTNKHHIFVNNKFSSPSSHSAQNCLGSSYLHGIIRNYDPSQITLFDILHVILTAR